MSLSTVLVGEYWADDATALSSPLAQGRETELFEVLAQLFDGLYGPSCRNGTQRVY